MIGAVQVNYQGYRAAHQGAAFYRVPDAGYLRVHGPDSAAFIQRQTTNDVRRLAPGCTQRTVLTSPTARVLDVWRLLSAGPDDIEVIPLPGRGAHTARYLQGRIFFMDKVTLTDLGAQFAQFEVIGPAAAGVFQALGLAQAPGPGVVVEWERDGVALRAVGPEQPGESWLIIAPADQADRVAEHLGTAGIEPLTPETYEVLRIEAGQPGPARELAGDYTPLEVNLDALVAGDKGCYTGQEVLARQVTYDKVTRRLAGLRLREPVNVGTAVEFEGRRVGEITSAAVSPQYGPIALAVLRRPHYEPGTGVSTGAVAGEVVALPFGAG